MIVNIHKGHLDYIRAKARNSSNEVFAYLIGSVNPDASVTIERLVYPRLRQATPTLVQPEDSGHQELLARCASEGKRVLGSIHSHPGSPLILSEADFSGHLSEGDYISGVIEVTCDRKTRVAFWFAHSALPCELHYL